jgi:succinate dehydrogenase/fumarate reductase flavoprotein subunit
MDFSKLATVQPEQDALLDFFAQKLLPRLAYRERPLHVAPLAHFCMGGVAVGESGETSVPGLHAVGEVAAGVHGANRLAGNALTEIIVFGRRAGSAAAAWARTEGSSIHVEAEAVAAWHETRRWAGNPEQADLTVQELREAVRTVAAEHLYVIRSGDNLRRAVERLSELQNCMTFVATGNELVSLQEVRNLLFTAQMVAQGALTRRESRGAHFRLDCPVQDDSNWRRHIVTMTHGGVRNGCTMADG